MVIYHSPNASNGDFMLYNLLFCIILLSPNNMYLISIKDLKSINGAKFHITIPKFSYSNPNSMYLI